jgi:hypothetical protein
MQPVQWSKLQPVGAVAVTKMLLSGAPTVTVSDGQARVLELLAGNASVQV